MAKSKASISTKGLVLQAKDNDELEKGGRFGFTVSKRVSKKAVVRNRIKRRLRAAVEEVVPSFKLSGCDYVVVGRKSSFDRPYEGLIKDLRYALHNVFSEAEQSNRGEAS